MTTGFGGAIPLTLGKDGTSQMFFWFGGILALVSIGTAIGAKRLLKDDP
jgi:hypothetical protein